MNRSNSLPISAEPSPTFESIIQRPKLSNHRPNTSENFNEYRHGLRYESMCDSNDHLELSEPHKAKLNTIRPAQFNFQVLAYHFTNDKPNIVNPPILLSLIQVDLTDAMDQLDPDFDPSDLDSHRFRISLMYGERQWVIKRRLTDFLKLHTSLKFGYWIGRDLVKAPKFPNRIIYNLNNFTHYDSEQPRNYKYYEQRRTALKIYLEKVLVRFNLVFQPDLFEFLELSTNSFVNGGFKGREGYLNLQLGSRFLSECLPIFLTSHKVLWCKLSDTCLILTDELNCKDPYEVILFAPNFAVEINKKLTESRLVVSFGLDAKMKFKVDSLHTLNDWHQPITKAIESCPYSKVSRFQSFAPVHNDIKITPLIDGDVYFKSVYEAILNAKSTIYIMDWWLSPEVFLLRPASKYPESRLDFLLNLKASQGVHIYILLYKEISLSLPNDSNHSKQQLKKLHPNIKVQRHPDHVKTSSVWFWAHHEKAVLVDNHIGFVGGLDLCFARYDTGEHKLMDTDPENPIWPGIDYSNVRVKDFVNVNNWEGDLIDRAEVPRLPWHDISMKVEGKVLDDLHYHFVERWNFIKRSKARNRPDIPFLLPFTQPAMSSQLTSKLDEEPEQSYQGQLLRSSSGWSSGIHAEHSIYTAYLELIANAKRFIYIENQFFVTAAMNYPSNTVKNLIGEALVNRIVQAHQASEKFKIIVILPLLPAFEHGIHHPAAITLRLVMHWQFQSIARGENSVLGRLSSLNIDWREYITFNGLRAYEKLPPKVHLSPSLQPQPQTKPSQSFTVNQTSTITPVTSHTEGVTTDAPVDQAFSSETSLTNLSLTSSALAETNPVNVVPHEARNTVPHEVKTRFATEQIYIHSKLMIVDDTFMLMGSANLNDRSQLGSRDSEIAVLVAPNGWDGQFTGDLPICDVVRNTRLSLFKEHCGSAFQAASTSSPGSVADDNGWNIALDPTTDQFWSFWTNLSSKNTDVFREVFHCVPDNLIHNWDQYNKFISNPEVTPVGHVDERYFYTHSSEELESTLDQIQGQLVDFPIDFLKEETKLAEIPAFAPEAVIPIDVFI